MSEVKKKIKMILEDKLKLDAVYPYGLSEDTELCYYDEDSKEHGDDVMEMVGSLEHVRVGEQQRREACFGSYQ